MSVEALTWAWRQHVGDPGAKHVLVCLADNASSTGVCWPGQGDIAKRTEYTPRTVRRHLQFLEERGMLHRIPRRRADGTRSSDLFVLDMPADSGKRADEIETRTTGKYGRWAKGRKAARDAASRATPGTTTGQDDLWSPADSEPPADLTATTGQILHEPPVRLTGHEPSGEPSGEPTPPPPAAQTADLPPPVGGIEGGSATPQRQPEDRAELERRVDAALAVIGALLPGEVEGWRTTAVRAAVQAAVRGGWTAQQIAAEITADWPSRVRLPAGLIATRARTLAGQESPAVAHARRLAAAEAEQSRRTAEREEADEQRRRLEEQLLALADEEVEALAREAWERLDRAVRGPEPSMRKPAVRGMALVILRERELVASGGGR